MRKRGEGWVVGDEDITSLPFVRISGCVYVCVCVLQKSATMPPSSAAGDLSNYDVSSSAWGGGGGGGSSNTQNTSSNNNNNNKNMHFLKGDRFQ